MRRCLCAAAPLGVLAFWIGLGMAARRYAPEYDWRYMTLSSLTYADRNPAGYVWAWGGLMLCALGGLCWTTVLFHQGRRAGGRRMPVGAGAFTLAYVCMAGALLPSRLLLIPKGHEILALSAFFGLFGGLSRLAFQATARRFDARVCAWLVAAVPLLPILMAGAASAYVSVALPTLPWVNLEWRARGVPVFLSFAFWEWTTCAVLTAYTTVLSLRTMYNLR